MTKKTDKSVFIVAYTDAGKDFIHDNIVPWETVFPSLGSAKKAVQEDGEKLYYSYKILKAEVVCETADLPVKITWKGV